MALVLVAACAVAPTEAIPAPDSAHAGTLGLAASDSIAPASDSTAAAPDSTGFAASDSTDAASDSTAAAHDSTGIAASDSTDAASDSTDAAPDSTDIAASDSTDVAPDSAHTARPGAGLPGPPVRPRSPTAAPDGFVFPADTFGVRWEIGAASEVSNEQFYEDAFVDSIALGRRLISDPEHRVAGVAWWSASGTRGAGRGVYNVQSELGLGDKRQSGSVSGWWRQKASSGLTASAAPRVELTRDRTFGRDLTHGLVSASTRLRQGWQDDTYGVELGTFAERFRAAGTGADFLPDRDVGRVSLIAQRAPLFGAESEIGYALTARVFPDSSDRDHLEHRVSARGKIGNILANTLVVDASVARRATRRPASTSRDAFREGVVDIDATWRVTTVGSLRTRLGGEALHYDRRDSTVFFDYRIARAAIAWQFEHDRWRVGVGPRAERLWSDDAPDEAYSEWSGAVEWEWIGIGPFWEILPAAGWRDYRDVPSTIAAGPAIPTARSAYAFYELSALADQPIPGSLRLRSQLQARWERHTDASQDARSLYFSIDVRRLF